ncbi:MAG: hypothetical protein JNJ59_21925 [Deltaproteobacteria bacterium]|nr:hypothetical protein [Deltaproteobacteria bacterium]
MMSAVTESTGGVGAVGARAVRGLGLGVVLAMGAGCAGSETGNGQQSGARRPVAIVVQLTGNPSLSGTDADGAELSVESGIALVDRLEFALPDGVDCDFPTVTAAYATHCDAGDARLVVDGPWTVDLVSGETWPPLDGLELPEGELGAIALKMKGDAGAARAALTLEGTFKASREAAGRPFALELGGAVVAKFDPGEALVVSRATTGLGLWLDVTGWFATLRLGSCIAAGGVPEVDGVLLLNRAEKRTCGNVEAALRTALVSSGRARSSE